jgi:hypothetical protein
VFEEFGGDFGLIEGERNKGSQVLIAKGCLVDQIQASFSQIII